MLLMARTTTYESWHMMKQRCLNPKATAYKWYGGRGIQVCERWLAFKNFLEDMGERPKGTTIDRINNEGNYEPNNCRWATWNQQVVNKRQTRKYLDIDLGKSPDEHGTDAAYQGGCHCGWCMAAHSEYCRETGYRFRRGIKKERIYRILTVDSGEPIPEGHGTISAYRKGCKCQFCKDANSAVARAYRRKRRN